MDLEGIILRGNKDAITRQKSGGGNWIQGGRMESFHW